MHSSLTLLFAQLAGVGITAAGTVGTRLIEGFPWIEALTVRGITLWYGEVAPLNPLAQAPDQQPASAGS